MTQQFKFGDRVYHTDTFDYPECGVVVGPENKYGEVPICFQDDYSYTVHIHPAYLKISPHPDTVRLDWLADPTNKIGSVLLPAECVGRHLDSLRDAIDAAMQSEEGSLK